MILLILNHPKSNHQIFNSPSLHQYEFIDDSVLDSKRDEDNEDKYINEMNDLMIAVLITDLNKELKFNEIFNINFDHEK